MMTNSLIDSMALPFMEAAGGLVTSVNNQALLIFKRGKWDLPKGVVEPGDSDLDTAIREVSEECGLNKGGLIFKGILPKTYHTTSHRGRRMLKKTEWFWLQYEGEEEDARPEVLEGIVECRWIKFSAIASYSPLMQVRVNYVTDFWHKNMAYAPRK